MFKIGNNGSDPSIIVPVKTNAVDLNVGWTLEHQRDLRTQWKAKFPKVKLEDSKLWLRTYTGEEQTIVGHAMVKVNDEDQECVLPIQNI